MAQALKTTVTELPDSRVRVQVQVAPEEVDRRIEGKARQLGRELKLPGFRRGKVPAPLVIQRIGREAVLEEALRETIPRWYSDAIESAGIVPVGDPELKVGELPPQGQALEFSIEIGVLPKAQLGEYIGVEAPRREPEVRDAEIDAEIEAMRERLARLETAERPAAKGDFVVVDYSGGLIDQDGPGQSEPIAGGEGRDQLIELGAGNLIPGFEEALEGAGAGEARTVRLRFPEDYSNGELAGREASFEVTVKEVKRKELPPVDDDLALDAGFEDLRELREDVREHILKAEEARVEAEFRQSALDAAVANARMELTPELVQARAREMWERMLHSLEHRGVSRESYLRISGRREQEVLEELEPEAELALRREAVITAVVAERGISPSDEDVLGLLQRSAEEGTDPRELLEQLRASGSLEGLREDLAARQAIDVIAENAKPIALAQAQARGKLWTPEKAASEQRAGEGAASGPARLWTPGR